jgi:hypothetical protein
MVLLELEAVGYIKPTLGEPSKPEFC